jgi:hypothetical protein
MNSRATRAGLEMILRGSVPKLVGPVEISAYIRRGFEVSLNRIS